MKKKLIIVGAIIIFIIIVIANISQKNDNLKKVTAHIVKKGKINQIVTGSGKLNPITKVNISSNVSGKIIKIFVKEGQKVKEGELLVQIDTAFYKAKVEEAMASYKSSVANVEVAKANFEKTKIKFENIKTLFEKKLCSEEEFLNTKTEFVIQSANYKSAKAAMDRAEAYLKQAQEDLNKTKIYSPLNGIVTRINSKEGEVILGTATNMGTIIMEISDMNKIQVVMEIDETEINKIKVGQPATIELDAIPGKYFTGKVSEVSYSGFTKSAGTQEEITLFTVKVMLDSVSSELKAQMSANVEITTLDKDSVLVIPIQSIVTSRKNKEKNKEFIYKISNNTVTKCEIKTGEADENNIEVLEGLTLNDTIVSGPFKLINKGFKDKEHIRIEKYE